jgi:SAM-dependent methyltransferase
VSELDPYFLGYRCEERERLERQANELAHESAWLFDAIGVRPGSSAVEIGCGPRGCLELLAERVGSAGRVVGVERNAEEVASAREFVAGARLANVQVVEADGRDTGLPAHSFDLATARLVLVNVPKPEQIVSEMVRLVRPGGTVALHEPDSTTQRFDPPLPALARLQQLLGASAERSGMDRSIALRTPRLLRELGLVDVQVNPLVHVYPPGHSRRALPLFFAEAARPRLLEQGLAQENEIDALIASLRSHLSEPGTLVVSSLFLQVWGRVPESRA